MQNPPKNAVNFVTHITRRNSQLNPSSILFALNIPFLIHSSPHTINPRQRNQTAVPSSTQAQVGRPAILGQQPRRIYTGPAENFDAHNTRNPLMPAGASAAFHPRQGSVEGESDFSEVSPDSSASKGGNRRPYVAERRAGQHGAVKAGAMDNNQDMQATHGEADGYYNRNQSFSSEEGRRRNSVQRRSRDHSQHRQHRRHCHRQGRPPIEEDHRHYLARSTLRPGTLGTLKGCLDLARNKSYLVEDTPERLDLLHRAYRFFNHGVIGKFGALDRKKTALIRKQMDEVVKGLRHDEDRARRRDRHHRR